jgi:nitroreductase
MKPDALKETALMIDKTLETRPHPDETDTPSMTAFFQMLVRERRSCRRFLPEPLPQTTVHELFSEAVLAPSNCNTQPWEVHVVSGAARDRMATALLEAAESSEEHWDFSFDARAYTGTLGERRQAQGAAYYQALGIKREDWQKRQGLSSENLRFFGAPHAAFLFMPEIGDSVRVASDVGMFAQTFLLALVARGLAGVPQTSLSRFPDVVRRELGLSAESKLLFGISFGRPDTTSASYQYSIGRDPVETMVSFHQE